METLADFKRLAVPGSVWECVNYLHPQVSGKRIVTKGKSVLSYDWSKADGSVGRNGRLEFPKRGEARFEGNSVHFLYDPKGDPERVAFTWTLIRPESEVSPLGS